MQMALLGSVRVFRGRWVFLRQLQLAEPDPRASPRRNTRVRAHQAARTMCGVRLGSHGRWRRGGLAVAGLLSVREIGHGVGRILKWRDLRKRADLRQTVYSKEVPRVQDTGGGLYVLCSTVSAQTM